MDYCKKCLGVSIRPGAKFTDGICLPCKFSNNLTGQEDLSKDKLNEFFAHVEKVKISSNKKKTTFSLGVSGGKDSLLQALFCRHVLAIEPTLVSVGYSPSQVTDVGVLNVENLLNKNFEVFTGYPSVKIAKNLAAHCFFEFGNLKIASEIALFSGAARLATIVDSDIVLWGENPAITIGDAGSLGINEFDGSAIKSINTLSQKFAIPKKILKSESFFYDIDEALESVAPRLVFMGSVIPNWSNFNNGLFSLQNGFTKRKDETDYLSLSAVDEDFVIINQYIKYLKYGFSRTTDIVNEMIRSNELTREQAIKLVDKHDGYIPDKELTRFSRYIDVDSDKIWKHLMSLANSELFEKSSKIPIPKFKVGQ